MFSSLPSVFRDNRHTTGLLYLHNVGIFGPLTWCRIACWLTRQASDITSVSDASQEFVSSKKTRNTNEKD